MADHTKIEWTDATWNPLAGCSRVSEGCRHCYAEGIAARGLPGVEGLARFVDRPDGSREARWTGAVTVREHLINQPLRWKRPRRIFVNSMSDLFHDAVPDEVIDRIFAVMALCPQHTFQVLTKRPERMRRYLAGAVGRIADAIMKIRESSDGKRFGVGQNGLGPLPNMSPGATWFPLPNVWLGTSVENQETADARIPDLLETPAAVRFISMEPTLGLVDLTNVAEDGWSLINALQPYTVEQAKEDWGESFDEDCAMERDRPALDLVIMGGESGPNARPMHPGWARQTRDQCAAAGVPFFFKQWGEWVSVSEVAGEGPHHRFPDGATVRRTGKRIAGRTLDHVEHNGMPEVHHG